MFRENSIETCILSREACILLERHSSVPKPTNEPPIESSLDSPLTSWEPTAEEQTPRQGQLHGHTSSTITWASFSEGPHIWSTFFCGHLKILKNFTFGLAFCNEVWCDPGMCKSRENMPGSATCTHTCPAHACAWGSVEHWRAPNGLLFLGTWAHIAGDGCRESNNAGDSGQGFRRAWRHCLQASLFFLGYVILCHTVIK